MAALLAMACLAAGCASLRSPAVLGPDRSDWERLLESKGVEADDLAYPLGADASMRETARRLAGAGRPRERLDKLQEALFDPDRFPFRYETRGTFTAAEAFITREGNCLSFTNLFIAMARSLGLPVRGAFPVYRGRSEREGNLILVNTHVVAAYPHGTGVDVFDFDRTRRGPNKPVVVIEDELLAALYLNNRGVEELRRGSVSEAVRLLEIAVRLAPDFAAAWGNLGVARRREGDGEGTLAAYRRALELEPRNPTVLTNLAGFYRSLGQEREATTALAAADLRHAASHVLLVQGDLAWAEGRQEDALALYHRARRRGRGSPDPLVAIARAEWARGRPDPARRALRKALRKAPDHAEAQALLAEIDRAASPGSGG